MQNNGWSFSWLNSSSDASSGYEWDGVTVETKPIHNSVEECRQRAQAGEELCSMEWLYLALEEDLRTSDDMVVTLMFAEGVNVEINRELLSSAYLIGIMALVVSVLLWLSLRRTSDVAIVLVGLALALMWMHWIIAIGFPIFTIGFITGSIWIEKTDGSYFSWKVQKTLPLLITWVIYGSLFLGRIIAGWRRKKVAVLSIIGFFSVIITYLLHAY